MASHDELRASFDTLTREGEQLAGGLNDLAQRATVYHHLFEASGRNHWFPLIAAHGALWARGYFRFGMKLGRLFSCQYLLNQHRRREQMQALEAFADAFRDVNHRVCIDTYAKFHFTARFGECSGAEDFIAAEAIEVLNQVHHARRHKRQLSESECRRVFEVHFYNEQETIVGPSIAQAVDDFRWSTLKYIALKPIIRFAYFPGRERLRFRNFSDKAERIERGLQAFQWGHAAGAKHVEAALRNYDVLPNEFFAGSAKYFQKVRDAVLTAGLT